MPDVYYEVEDSEIYVVKKEQKEPLALLGVTWVGFELRSHVVGGLHIRNWLEILQTVKDLGFNAIRIPFCSASVRPRVFPHIRSINYALNPDLLGLDSPTILEKIIAKAAELGLYALLNFHSISCVVMEPLWYTPLFSEEDFISTWVSIAKRYGRYWNVIGAELLNNPHGRGPRQEYYTRGDSATWGVGNTKTDWNLAAERVGKAILEVAPHWLIVVKGTQFTNPKSDDVKHYPDSTYWGENLRAVKDYPVNLPRNKLVYGVNTYGPDMYVQDYFNDPSIFPENLHVIWDQNWGYVKKQLRYPVVITEFGGKCGDGDPRDAVWHEKFIEYLIENNFCQWFYLALNPEHVETGGLLKNDWRTVKENKYALLKKLMEYCRNRYSKA
ncbi:MAG: glycoside hydrolase family 5 protein [Ignisphaera sp.]